MKQTSLKFISALLSLVLLLSLSACQSKGEEASTENATSQNQSLQSADEYGVTTLGYISEQNFPANEELKQWYDKTEERTNLVWAIFYGKDESNGLWYCWLYADGCNPSDSLRIQIDNRERTQVHLEAQSTKAVQAGAFCFAFPSENEPAFSLLVDGEKQGLIVTHTGNPAIPNQN